MKSRRLVATVASACTFGLIVGLGTVAFVGSAGAASHSGNRKYEVTLNGTSAVPPADLDGTGTGKVKVKAKQSTVCVVFKKIANIGPAIAAHIHQAPAGMNGPIVVPLATPVQAGKYQKSKTCAVVSATLLAGLQNNPSGFYLNVHTGAFPSGAIRGQLPLA
jgi:hypothetical protein